jgi:hypothetical protein
MIVNELSLDELESEGLNELPTRDALSGLFPDITVVVVPQVAVAIAVAPLGGSAGAAAGNLLYLHLRHH